MGKNIESNAMRKIYFRLEEGAWHGSASEGVWAEQAGSGRFKILSIPFYAFGVSLGDVVSAAATEFDDPRLFVANVLIPSGNSTYRYIADKRAAPTKQEALWGELEEWGCSREAGPGSLFAVNVPPSASINDVYSILVEGEEAGLWGFEEGNCAHSVR